MKAIVSHLVLVLCIADLAANSVRSFPVNQSRDQTKRLLDLKEDQLERLYATYWQVQYELEQGDTSISDKEVQRKIREVLDDPPFLDELRSAALADSTLRRRRELFLEVAIDSQISTDARLARLVESARKDGSTIRYRVGDRSLDRPQLDNVLAHDPNRQLRREAWYAQADLTRLTGERIRRAIKIRNQLAARYAGASFTDFMLKRRATERHSLSRWYEQIRTSTEPGYRALLAQIQRGLHVDTVEPWDLEYYFSTLTPELDQKIGMRDAWPRTKEVAEVLGFDFDHLPVSVKFADITFGGYTMPIWYGKDIKMLVSKHTGIQFADTILHESGHALHFSFVDEPTFILRDNYPPPMDEGLGQVMCLMIYRPEIATGIYGLTASESEELAERHRLQSDYALRALMAHSEFELQAYANPEQDLTALQNHVCSKYLGVDCRGSNTWGYDPFYAAIPLYEQNYVLAEMFAYQVHHTLERRFGAKYGKEAGQYLHDKFLIRGGMLKLGQIMEQGTGESLTADFLIAALNSPREHHLKP
jgi:oligoendopeptidase F